MDRGEGPAGKRLLPQPGPGSAEGRSSGDPVGAWPAAAPAEVLADPRLAGTCHRHLPPLPTRTARGGGGGGGDGIVGVVISVARTASWL